jgi:hypothetical protein
MRTAGSSWIGLPLTVWLFGIPYRRGSSISFFTQALGFDLCPSPGNHQKNSPNWPESGNVLRMKVNPILVYLGYCFPL